MAPGVVQDVGAQYQQTPTGNAPTAMMIDPSLQFSQAQDGSSQQGNAPKVPQAAGQPQQSSPNLTRTLSSWDINQESIDDAYVQFILYCNPSIPSGTDTTELRKGFRSMPKSDGKSFDTFALFELIQKLEAKEIETWSQLVIDLGVEPPDPAKNQSAQKVQQFAVRMKVCARMFGCKARPAYVVHNSIAFRLIQTDISAGSTRFISMPSFTTALESRLRIQRRCLHLKNRYQIGSATESLQKKILLCVLFCQSGVPSVDDENWTALIANSGRLQSERIGRFR